MSPPTPTVPNIDAEITNHPALSYELFPPRNAQANEALWRTIRELEGTAPDYVSVTYGAGGSNQGTALELLERLQNETRLRPLAHLTCVGSSGPELARTIEAILGRGVRGILALRGDAPAGRSGRPSGELRYAQQLVELIRRIERQRTAHLAAGKVAIGVAAYSSRHPESPSFEHDVEVLLAKQSSGADFAITQIFFDAKDYSSLLRRARQAGVRIPIIPGIMPLTSVRRLDRLAQLAGIDVDLAVRDRLASAGDDSTRQRIGIQATVDLASAALDAGAPGLHVYTFNEHVSALQLLEKLQLPRPAAPVRHKVLARA
jgi:methylenetetrahydrofolate reductase (NADPH)